MSSWRLVEYPTVAEVKVRFRAEGFPSARGVNELTPRTSPK